MKYFLSYILDPSTPSYGNRDNFIISPKSKIVNGQGANTSSWNFSNNHIGTHIDTPFHFMEDGKKTKDFEPDDFFYQKIHLIEKKRSKGDLISLEESEMRLIPSDVEFLIIKTGYGEFRSEDKYHNDNPGLKSSLAGKLKKRFLKLKAVGFDFISLTSWNYREHGRESHRSFLGDPNNFLVVEDMDLGNIDSKTKFNWVIVAPLRTSDGNGGPVTIIADVNEK